MQVILLQDVRGLGKKGESKQVKDGYGLNHLLPRGLAARAGSAEATNIERATKHVEQQKAKQSFQAAESVAQFENTTRTITAKASPGGKLFGAVSANDIAHAFGAIDAKIIIPEPIRSVGTHSVELQFDRDHRAKVQIVVVSE